MTSLKIALLHVLDMGMHDGPALFFYFGQKQPNPFASDAFIILSLLQDDTNMLQ